MLTGNKSFTSAIKAIPAPAAVSAKKTQSARSRSTATAAESNATAIMERYCPSVITLAPRSTLIAPAKGYPSAVWALFQTGCTRTLSGSTWMIIQNAGTSARAAGTRIRK